jgi:hypothetical protein
MQLIATFGTLGFSTLLILIAELRGHDGLGLKRLVVTSPRVAGVAFAISAVYAFVYHIAAKTGEWIYATPLGVALFGVGTALTWSVWLVALTPCYSLAGLPRHVRSRAADAPAQGSRGRIRIGWRRPSWPRMAAAAVTVLALTAAAAVTEVSANSSYDKPITQLSVLTYAASEPRSLQVSVTNQSARLEHFTLLLGSASHEIARVQFDVDPSKTWSRMDSSAPPSLRAALIQPGKRQPVREVTWNG